MRTLVAFVISMVAIFFSAQPPAAAQLSTPIPFYMGWHVAIGVDGSVQKLEPIKNDRIDRVPAIRVQMEQAIRNWQFVPGMIDGKPAATQTGLWIRATVLPGDGNSHVRIRIDHASVGGTVAKQMPPIYPGSAVRQQITGQVVLRIGYDADGKVTSAALDPESPQVKQVLIDASLRAARRWKFQPEVVGGHPLAGYAITPFCYRLRVRDSNRKLGKCNWKSSTSDESIGAGELLTLNPAAHLLSDVSGRVL